MSRNIFSNILLFICLIFIQVLACNHIMLFNVALAFVFIYVIIRLPIDMNPIGVLTWGFLAGLAVDIFADTPGVNALACTIMAMFRKPILFLYVPQDDRTKNIIPSLQSLGFAVYGKYLYSISLMYCLLVFSIEYFNFASVKEIIILSLASSLFTFLILLGTDSLMVTQREKRL